jgi:hypothetical protein
MGFKPHMVYSPEARVQAKLPPRVERLEDSDVDFTRSVDSFTESLDRVEDSDELCS